MTKKVTISGIDSQQLKAVCVLVPPKQEQRAIVDFIRVKDAEFQKLIHKVHQALDRLREFRSALIAAAVTGKIDVREEVA
jgi:type I restriction enzyme S subunit